MHFAAVHEEHHSAARCPPSSPLSPPKDPHPAAVVLGGWFLWDPHLGGKGVLGMDGAWQGAAPWGGEARGGKGTQSPCNLRRRRNLLGLGEWGNSCLKQ